MLRSFILGAAAAAAIGLAAPAAQAHMANPALGVTAPASLEHAQYYRRYHSWRRNHWRRGYAWYPRRCWTERVRTWNGYVRYVRRCR